MSPSPEYVDRLVAVAADHWLIHPATVLAQGRASQACVCSRWAIVRVLSEQGWPRSAIASAIGRVGADATNYVRHALRKEHYDDEEVEVLAAILREVPR